MVITGSTGGRQAGREGGLALINKAPPLWEGGQGGAGARAMFSGGGLPHW